MIILRHENSKKTVLSFPYSKFEQSDDFKAEIYNLVYNNGKKMIQLYCDCTKKLIPLTIAKREETIYIKNAEESGEKHKETCPLYKENEANQKPGWTVMYDRNNKETFIVNLKPIVFGIKGTVMKGSNLQLSLLDFITKFNVSVWQYYLDKNKEKPNDIQTFLRQVYGSSKKITFLWKPRNLKAQTLRDVLYTNKNKEEANQGDYLFIFLPFKYVVKTKNNKVVLLNLISYSSTGEYTTTVLCNSEMFENSFKIFEEKSRKNKSQTITMVCGFVEKLDKDKFAFKSLEFISVLNSGLIIDVE